MFSRDDAPGSVKPTQPARRTTPPPPPRSRIGEPLLNFMLQSRYKLITHRFDWWNLKTGTTFVSWSIIPQAHSPRPSADTISHASHPPSPASITLVLGLGGVWHPCPERTIRKCECSRLKNGPTV
ncbi:hypothetical protein E2C01_030374 [Portunus trituberculatus]|uniref:Uncharacterized protein n=1 Tax=Portunus trituberculatus TaxID=210409 RepID=A0A5B7EU34_PORTR|nr:hypothetical protein [Portunus trituberculatus]